MEKPKLKEKISLVDKVLKDLYPQKQRDALFAKLDEEKLPLIDEFKGANSGLLSHQGKPIQLSKEFSNAVKKLMQDPTEHTKIKNIIESYNKTSVAADNSAKEDTIKKLEAELDDKLSHSVKEYLAIKFKWYDPSVDKEFSPAVLRLFDGALAPIIHEIVETLKKVHLMDRKMEFLKSHVKILESIRDKDKSK